MSFFDSIVLGIVEGITEFLPISSTAHLMMTAKVLGVAESEFLKSFEIIIQLGAVAAVIWVFASRFAKSFSIWKKIAIAFIPTAVIGLILYELIKTYLIGNLLVAVWALIIGGLALIAIEHFISKRPEAETKGDIENISNKQAFFIGVAQSLAIIPGVSRAASTIVPALLFGASRKAAAEFSFLLAVPTITAAAGYDIVKNLNVFDGNLLILFTGFITSFIASILTIKLFLSFIQKHSFTSFGIYRIVIAILFFILFIR